MLTPTWRIGKFAFQNFWRNFWLSLITVSMLVLTLMTVNLLVLLNVVTQEAIGFVEDRIEVSVYFHETATEEEVENTERYLENLTQVRSVSLVSADEALEQFRARHATDDAIIESLDELGENPFGPTLVVKAQSASQFPVILDALENPSFRDAIRDKDFSDFEEITERIRQTTDRIRWFGVVLTGIFLLIAILIIFNTVRIGIFVHREEIGIMKLVGASDWFVKAPFLLETLIYSLLSVLVVAAVIFPLVAFIEPHIDVYLGGHATHLAQYFEENVWYIFGSQMAGLVFVNLVSTSLAMRRYLRV